MTSPLASLAKEPARTALESEAPAVSRRSAPPHLGRVAGALWFLMLAVFYGHALVSLLQDMPAGGVPFERWAPALSRGCTTIFFVTLAWLMVARPAAVARREGLVPLLISMVGTYGVWLVAFLPAAVLSPAMGMVSAAVTLTGSILIVFSIVCLGTSFSIAPQARALITHGPYRIVRHPLYAAEEIAIVGVAMNVAWWAAAPFLIVHIALQLRRMSYEETLLRSVFPEYDAYAKRTARLIPGVW